MVLAPPSENILAVCFYFQTKIGCMIKTITTSVGFRLLAACAADDDDDDDVDCTRNGVRYEILCVCAQCAPVEL